MVFPYERLITDCHSIIIQTDRQILKYVNFLIEKPRLHVVTNCYVIIHQKINTHAITSHRYKPRDVIMMMMNCVQKSHAK